MKNRFFNIAVQILFGVSLLIIASCGNPMEPFNPKIVSQSKDETAPVIEVTSPSADSDYSQTVTVTGTITDDGTVMPTLNYSVSDALGSQSKDGVVEITPVDDNVEGAAGTFSFEFTTSEYSSDILLTLQGSDWNENESDPVTIRLVYPGSAIPSFSAKGDYKNVLLNWEPVEGANTYNLYYTTNGNPPGVDLGEAILDISGEYTSDSPYVLENLSNGKLHAFRLMAISEDGSKTWVSAIEYAVPLSKFTLSPTVYETSSQLDLEWADLADSRYDYAVYRSDTKDGNFIKISGSLTENSFEDRTAVEGHLYWYAIAPEIEGSILSWAESGKIFPFIADTERIGKSIDTPGRALDVLFTDSYAYIADKSGLEILDTSNLESPTLLSSKAITYSSDSDGPKDLSVAEDRNLLLAASGTYELRIYDISNPGNPSEIRSINSIEDSSHVSEHIAYAKGYAYIAISNDGIYSASLTNPETTVIVNEKSLSKRFYGLEYCSETDQLVSIVLNTDTSYDLYIYSVTTPDTDPTLGDAITVNLSSKAARSVSLYYSSEKLYAYIACSSDGILLYNVTDSINVGQVLPAAGFPTPNSTRVSIDGSNLYVSDNNQYYIFDISNPEVPELKLSTSTVFGKMSIKDRFGYVASELSGIKVVDISPAPNPIEKASFDYSYLSSESQNCVMQGDYVYMSSYSSSTPNLIVFDIGSASSGSISDPWVSPETGSTTGLVVKGDYAFMVEYNLPESIVLMAYNISNLNSIDLIGSLELPTTCYSIAQFGDYLYLAEAEDGMAIVDISNPEELVLLSFTKLSDSAVDINVRGNNAYVIAGTSLATLNITNKYGPEIIAIDSSIQYIKTSFSSKYLSSLGVSSSRVVMYNYIYPGWEIPLDSTAVDDIGDTDGIVLNPSSCVAKDNYIFYLTWDEENDTDNIEGLRVVNTTSIFSPYCIDSTVDDTTSMWALDVSGDTLCVMEGDRFVVYSLK